MNGIVRSDAIKISDVNKANKKFNDVDKNPTISFVSPTTPQDVSVDPIQPLIVPNNENDDQVEIPYFEESEVRGSRTWPMKYDAIFTKRTT